MKPYTKIYIAHSTLKFRIGSNKIVVPKKNFQVLLLIIFLLPGVNSSLLAQETKTLDDILEKVRENNPVLQAYEYKIDALNAYAEGAKSWMPPMVGAGTFMTPYPGQELMEGQAEGMFMIAAEQAIPNPAKLEAKQDFMESKAAISVAERNGTYNQLRAQVKNAYYQWLVLEKKKAVLQENREIIQTMLKLAEIRYPYNQGSLGSIYKAEGRLGEVENMLLMTNNNIIEKNIKLNTLMDIPEETRYEIDTTLQDFTAPLRKIDASYLLQNRSDLQQIEKKIASVRLGIELEKAQSKPDFSISFEHMMPYNGMMPNQFSVMGMVSIPIAPWSAKGYKANIKGKRFEVAALEKKQEVVINKAQGMIGEMLTDIRTMRQQLENYREKIIPALRKNYETTLLAYEQNESRLPLVIDAWEALNMIQMQYLEQLDAYYSSVVQYEKELELE